MDKRHRGVAELPGTELEWLGSAVGPTQLRCRAAEPGTPIDPNTLADGDPDARGNGHSDANCDRDSVCDVNS